MLCHPMLMATHMSVHENHVQVVVTLLLVPNVHHLELYLYGCRSPVLRFQYCDH